MVGAPGVEGKLDALSHLTRRFLRADQDAPTRSPAILLKCNKLPHP
jgi:hypothetical protein